MRCYICKKEHKNNIYKGKDYYKYTFPVCSLNCLIRYIELMKPNHTKFPILQENQLSPFKSELEKIFYETVSPFITLEYEKHTLSLSKRQVYTPDFYVPEKNIYIEIKGGNWNISKFKKYSKFGIYIVFPKLIIGGNNNEQT